MNLKRILSQGHYELRIDLEDWNNETRYATYNAFDITGPESNYKLKVAGYFGTAGIVLVACVALLWLHNCTTSINILDIVLSLRCWQHNIEQSDIFYLLFVFPAWKDLPTYSQTSIL